LPRAVPILIMLIPDYQNILRHLSAPQSDIAFRENTILKTYTDKYKAEFSLVLSGILNDSETSPALSGSSPISVLFKSNIRNIDQFYLFSAICSKNKNIIS
jgi:hypothetical protein